MPRSGSNAAVSAAADCIWATCLPDAESVTAMICCCRPRTIGDELRRARGLGIRAARQAKLPSRPGPSCRRRRSVRFARTLTYTMPAPSVAMNAGPGKPDGRDLHACGVEYRQIGGGSVGGDHIVVLGFVLQDISFLVDTGAFLYHPQCVEFEHRDRVAAVHCWCSLVAASARRQCHERPPCSV